MSEISFPYSSIPAEHTDELRLAAERIRIRLSRAADDIAAIGIDLLAVKDRLSEGQFSDWIETEFNMSRASAYRFIAVAKRFGDDVSGLRHMTAEVIYELAAPSTPESVVEEIKERAELGEAVTAEEVRRLRREAAEANTKIDSLNMRNKILVGEKDELSDRIADLESDQPRVPEIITVQPDRAVLETLYEGFVAHWRSLPMELRERFFDEHRTPFAATNRGDIPGFLVRS